MGLFELLNNNKQIEKAKYLGVRTGKQTGLFATYNFSVYTFFVQYIDGTTETIEISSDDKMRASLLRDLLEMTSDNAGNNNGTKHETHERTASSIFADLNNIKNLFDSNVITSEMYNEQKEVLLAELEAIKDVASKKIEHNLSIRRSSKRPMGEAKVIVLIDGKKLEEIDTDNVSQLSLPEGNYNIQFKRGMVTSPVYKIELDNTSLKEIVFNTSAFSISAVIK